MAPTRRSICRRLTTRIHEVTPPGLGHWGPAWDIVVEPSERFLDAMEAFLDHDDNRTRHAIHDAAGAVVAAWEQAAREWEAAGRPGDTENQWVETQNETQTEEVRR